MFLALSLATSGLSAQTPPPATAAAPSPPARATTLQAPAYRGFVPGMAYRDFAARARSMARKPGDALVCNTSKRTAQLMECGLLIRDTTDGAALYLSAYVLESTVAMVSFGDSGTAALVERTGRNLTTRFGRPQSSRAGTWQWQYGHQYVRYNWRGRGAARWIYVNLWDQRVMDGISKYVTRTPAPAAPPSRH